LIYENVRSGIDAFFLGYHYTPSNLRQSKAHWLTKTRFMIAYCPYNMVEHQLGPAMAHFGNYHERLAVVLPNAQIQVVWTL
jgi:hypothetical protein